MEHIEQHFSGSEAVRDVVIGMADGLTVPFALAAGISGALTSTHIVVTAGLAEIAAGSIAMGLGGYLAARSDVEHFLNERRREGRGAIDSVDHCGVAQASKPAVSQASEPAGGAQRLPAPFSY